MSTLPLLPYCLEIHAHVQTDTRYSEIDEALNET